MNIQDIFNKSITRAIRWHGGDINQWSPLEWAGAMCGEAGECANAAKKLKRITDNLANINEAARDLQTKEQASEKVILEVCDTVLYAVLVAASVGCDPIEFEDKLRATFNKKSVEYGFPERL
jgi:NTP pyrophosphatase (non-canonical NTP hydrolase)